MKHAEYSNLNLTSWNKLWNLLLMLYFFFIIIFLIYFLMKLCVICFAYFIPLPLLSGSGGLVYCLEN